MRLNCNINGSQYSLVVNSDKPLSHILREQIMTFGDNTQCQGASCGNCIVLINGNAALSCLVPAFKLNGASILTFEGFQKTRFCHDIERAYADVGNQPCPQCYPSKTIIIESILNKIDKENQNRIGGFQMAQGPHNDMSPNSQATASANEQAARSRMGTSGFTTEMIAKELAMSSCQCIEVSDLEKIINLAYKYRSRRRARRS
ncbi:MAG: ferredoxin [Spirochaetales bacterium]|nr:ferredoxin [Spirochaetales bacterium]